MRERNLAAYTSGKVRVLVATDIAARGIHVDDISLVVHVDPPAEHKAYLHRSGRTARAGASGIVVTVAMPDQRRDVASLMRGAAINPTETAVSAGAQQIRDVVGPAAEYVDPEMSAVLLAPIVERSNPRRSGRPGGSSYSGGNGGSGGRGRQPRAGGVAPRVDGGLGARPRRTK
jgi:superfamily II DNA/RNA helicase